MATKSHNTHKPDKKSADWDSIVTTLLSWRAELSIKDPSVTTIAEIYEKNAWAVLISTIISLRTKDNVTLAASKRLLSQCPNPQSLIDKTDETIERLIYPAGFYKTKTQSMKKIAVILLEKYAGAVPDTLEDLLALPGVGRKTANLVLIEAFDKDGICVDTHVHRISNRAGWVETKKPDDTEMVLREILPKKHWKVLNAILVLYGQRVCMPIKTRCEICVIRDYCLRTFVNKEALIKSKTNKTNRKVE
jgi:endonuclease-3